MRNPALAINVPVIPPRPRRPLEVGAIVGAVSLLLRDAAQLGGLALDDVAGWCAEIGGVDPRLEHAALRHAQRVIDLDALVADLAAHVRARLTAAGELLPALVARGGVARVLAVLGLDDVDPPPGAMIVAMPPRIARFYWQRLRAYVAWRAAVRS